MGHESEIRALQQRIDSVEDKVRKLELAARQIEACGMHLHEVNANALILHGDTWRDTTSNTPEQAIEQADRGYKPSAGRKLEQSVNRIQQKIREYENDIETMWSNISRLRMEGSDA